MKGFLFFSIILIEYLGIGYSLPIVTALKVPLLIALSLFLYLVFQRGLREMASISQTRLLLLFTFLTVLSLVHAYVTYYVFNVLKAQIGYLLLFCIVAYIFDSKDKIYRFVVGFVLLHVLLVIRNIDMLTSFQRVGSFKSGYFLGDGNDFGWALAIAIPLSIYLMISSERLILKLIGAVSCSILIFGVVGTQSRGATLAMVAPLIYYVIVSRRRLVPILLIAAGIIGVLWYAPGQYFERMETITAYSEDSSAMGRINAWKAAAKMSIDHPLGVGAGNFNSVYGREYRTDDAPSARWLSVHSIYFSVLGEYGVFGLITILLILYVNFKDNILSGKELSLDVCRRVVPENWPKCLNMAIIAYAVGGFFLGGVEYPHIYILSGLTVATRMILQNTSVGGDQEARMSYNDADS